MQSDHPSVDVKLMLQKILGAPIDKLIDYAKFTLKCGRLLWSSRKTFLLFIVLSILGALTEGISVALMIPLLQSQGEALMFTRVPLLSHVEIYFSQFEPQLRLQFVSGLLLLVVFARNALLLIASSMAMNFPLKLKSDAAARIFRGLLYVDLSFIQHRKIGELQTQVLGYPAYFAQVLIAFSLALSNVFVLAVYVGLMCMISWRVTILSVAFFLICLLILRTFTTTILRRAGGAVIEMEAKLTQTTVDALQGIKSLRLANAQRAVFEKLRTQYQSLTGAQATLNILNSLPSPFLTMAATTLICGIIYAGARYNEGAVVEWLPALLIFVFMMLRLLAPINSLVVCRNTILAHMRVFDEQSSLTSRLESTPEPSGDRPYDGLRNAIEFRDVCLTYPGQTHPALDGIDITVPRGGFVAIVGPSGAGKSTIAALLARFITPDSGAILVDGIDLSRIDLAQWRAKLSLVSQDSYIFQDTLDANILYGNPAATPERVREAASQAALNDAIMERRLENASTNSEDSKLLSSGQQQRIALARAFVADSDLLILDEATSHLDSVTEVLIQAAVKSLAATRTLIVIAHRLSTIRHADRIYVMDGGRVVDAGTHAELMARSGRYAEMHAAQQG